MKSYEVLARRYCAFLGEDPDAVIEGLPAWRIALVDLEAALNALDTFGIDARAPMQDVEFDTLDQTAEQTSRCAAAKNDTVQAPSSAEILAFRRVA